MRGSWGLNGGEKGEERGCRLGEGEEDEGKR